MAAELLVKLTFLTLWTFVLLVSGQDGTGKGTAQEYQSVRSLFLDVCPPSAS